MKTVKASEAFGSEVLLFWYLTHGPRPMYADSSYQGALLMSAPGESGSSNPGARKKVTRWTS